MRPENRETCPELKLQPPLPGPLPGVRTGFVLEIFVRVPDTERDQGSICIFGVLAHKTKRFPLLPS